MKFSIYTAAALVIGLAATHGAAAETASSAAAATTTTEAKDILVAAVGDMLDPDGGGGGVRGTNKTLAPTPGVSRPPDTPFPTEASVTTPAPVPEDDTPSPMVRYIYYIVYTVRCEKIYIAILYCDCTHLFSSSCICIAIYIYFTLYV